MLARAYHGDGADTVKNVSKVLVRIGIMVHLGRTCLARLDDWILVGLGRKTTLIPWPRP